MIVMFQPAADAKDRMTNMQEPIVFGSPQQRDIAIIVIVGIMQAVAVGRIKLVQLSAFVLELPPIGDAEANGDNFLHNVSVLLHEIAGIFGILTGLKQHIVLIEKHLPASARRLMELLLYIGIHSKEYQADLIQHIGNCAGLILTAI
mgnify:CR=1 FL=1